MILHSRHLELASRPESQNLDLSSKASKIRNLRLFLSRYKLVAQQPERIVYLNLEAVANRDGDAKEVGTRDGSNAASQYRVPGSRYRKQRKTVEGAKARGREG